MEIKNMKQKNKLSANMEDYLEAIASLKRDKGVARVRDISVLMNVKTPSVTNALNVLSSKKFIIHEKYGYVDLTKEGEKLAKTIRQKHEIFVRFLSDILNIDPVIAEKDACKMEHAISPETFKRLTKFVESIDE